MPKHEIKTTPNGDTYKPGEEYQEEQQQAVRITAEATKYGKAHAIGVAVTEFTINDYYSDPRILPNGPVSIPRGRSIKGRR